VCTRTEVSGDRGGAPPGTRTPNPLIVGLICSTLLVAVRNCPLTWAYAVRSWFVAAVRFLTLPIESRPVSRPETPFCRLVRPARVDGYVSWLLPPRRIAGLGMITWRGSPDRLTDVLAWLVFALLLGGPTLTLIAPGWSTASIGWRLHLSPDTTGHHVTHMLRQANTVNRSQLVALAYVSGMLDGQAGWPHSPTGRRCLTSSI
jgi:hypothetical protein